MRECQSCVAVGFAVFAGRQVLTSVDILLVGEDKQHDVAHFAVLDDAAELGFGFFHARAVAGVYYEDEGVGSWAECQLGLAFVWGDGLRIRRFALVRLLLYILF